MDLENNQKILDTLCEIRDGQQQIVALLTAQQALAQEQVLKSRASIAESMALQREALKRQRTLSLVAVCPRSCSASQPSRTWF
jgi:hypothetical protein